MTTEERQLNDRIEEVAIKSLRREQLLEQKLGNLERELIEQKVQSKFQNNMIGILLIGTIVATIIF
tara:strand:+ start:2889 stop:3086 length:198 start_codon:yes stop_codon:yes gene_type:complete